MILIMLLSRDEILRTSFSCYHLFLLMGMEISAKKWTINGQINPIEKGKPEKLSLLCPYMDMEITEKSELRVQKGCTWDHHQHHLSHLFIHSSYPATISHLLLPSFYSPQVFSEMLIFPNMFLVNFPQQLLDIKTELIIWQK